jgi:chromosome segregation ATPase
MRAIVLALCIVCALTIDITDGFTNHQQQVFA